MINFNIYRKFNPDLNSLNNRSLSNHYNNFSIQENRIKCIETFFLKYPLFNIDKYKLYNNDLKHINDSIDLMVHWHLIGVYENRKCNDEEYKNNNEILHEITNEKESIVEITENFIAQNINDEITVNDIFWKKYEEHYYFKDNKDKDNDLCTFIIISDDVTLITNLINNIKNYFNWNILLILNGIDFFINNVTIIKIEKTSFNEIHLIKNFALNFINTKWFIFLENGNILTKNFINIFNTELYFRFDILIFDDTNIIFNKDSFSNDIKKSNGFKILNYNTLEFKNDRIYELRNKISEQNFEDFLNSFKMLSNYDVKKEIISIFISKENNEDFIHNALNNLNYKNMNVIILESEKINLVEKDFILLNNNNNISFSLKISILLMSNYIISDNDEIQEIVCNNYKNFKKIFLHESIFNNNKIGYYPNNVYFLNSSKNIDTNKICNYKILYNHDESKIGKTGIIFYKNNYYLKNNNNYCYCNINEITKNILFDYITINILENSNFTFQNNEINILLKTNIILFVNYDNINNLELNLFKIGYFYYNNIFIILDNKVIVNDKILNKYNNIKIINNNLNKSNLQIIFELTKQNYLKNDDYDWIIGDDESIILGEEESLFIILDNKYILNNNFSIENINYHFFLNPINFSNLYSDKMENIFIFKNNILNYPSTIQLLKNFFINRTQDFFIEDLIIFFKKIDKNYYLLNESNYEENYLEYNKKDESLNGNNPINTNTETIIPTTNYIEKIKIYFINLDKRTDRLNDIQIELHKIGLNTFERFSGIIPTQIQSKKCSFIKPQKLLIKNNISYLRGAMGCKMSHYEILKKELIAKNDYEYLMILEDDCNFEENTIININLALNQLIEKNIDWDILYLSTNLKKKEDATKISNNLLKIKCGLTTTSQLFPINKLQKIIDIITNSNSEIDNTYNDLLNEKYCVYPMCVYQRRSFSDIQEMDLNYGHFHNKFIY